MFKISWRSEGQSRIYDHLLDSSETSWLSLKCKFGEILFGVSCFFVCFFFCFFVCLEVIDQNNHIFKEPKHIEVIHLHCKRSCLSCWACCLWKHKPGRSPLCLNGHMVPELSQSRESLLSCDWWLLPLMLQSHCGYDSNSFIFATFKFQKPIN